MQTIVAGEDLYLLAEKAIFWKRENALIIADVHFGKVSHFRKNGIKVPSIAGVDNYRKLAALIQDTGAKRIIFLGDLFHSKINREWDQFADFLGNFPRLKIDLVKGNHDILPENLWKDVQVKLHPRELTEGPFYFTHEKAESIPDGLYNLYGHIHPAIKLVGKGRQMLRLPCFCFGSREGILPAFGEFTGLFSIEPHRDDQVFVPMENRVIRMN